MPLLSTLSFSSTAINDFPDLLPSLSSLYLIISTPLYNQSIMATMTKLELFVRVLNVSTALVLIGFGVAGLIFMAVNSILSGKFFLVFSPVFMAMFGVLLLAAEFKVEFLLKHFVFLKSMVGRGIFNIYLASSVFYYFSCGTNNDVVAWIAAIVIFLLGIVYFVLACCLKSKPEETPDSDRKTIAT